MKDKVIKLKLGKILDFIIALSVIINSGTAISIVYLNISFFLLVLSFGILLYRYAKFIRLKNKKLTLLNFNVILILIGVILSSIINFSTPYIIPNIKFILLILSAFFIVKLYDKDILINFFIKYMFYICLISLIFYTISIISPQIIKSFPIITNINDVDYYSIGIYNAATYSLARNMGIFWEPSLFASFICFATLLEIHYTNKISIFRIVLFIVSLLTSQSTGGYLCYIIILATIPIKSRIKTFSEFKGMCILITCILLIMNWDSILYYLYTLNPLVFSKLVQKDHSISYFARTSCPEVNLMIFKSHFLFGAGIGNTGNIFYKITRGVVSQTSTTTYSMAVFGLIGLALPMSFVYKVLFHNKKGVILKIFIILVVFIIINKESHFNFLLTYILFFLFLEKNMQVIEQKELCLK